MMKSKGKFITLALGIILALVLSICLVFTGCSSSHDDDETEDNPSGQDGDDVFVNPGDYLGGGQEYTGSATLTTTTLASDALNAVGTVSSAVYTTEADVLEYATEVTTDNRSALTSGAYYIGETNAVAGKKITVTGDGVTLYLINATVYNDGTAIESDGYDLTITLIGDNTIYNTNDDKNVIDLVGTLTINGPGTLSISSTKNVKANAIIIADTTVTIDAVGDGLHAEIDKYDKKSVTTAPEFSYADGGFVYTKDATVTITAESDGIQADTFVYIDEGSSISISATGKGIKAGLIDWGKEGYTTGEIEEGDYLIYINGDVTITAIDDAIHSNNTVLINDGNLYLITGDDAIHAEELLQVYGGYIEVSECYEGLEAAKVEVTGGYVNVTSKDDGINGADGTTTAMGQSNSNCHIIINGGVIYVDAGGDGVDSNGDMLISGGMLYVSGSTNSSDAALDSDGGILITGGYVFACGALGMVETPSTSSTQYVISYAQSSTISAGTTLYLKDSGGNTLLYYTVPKDCQSVILSSPDLAKGSTYSIYGESTQLASCTISSVITSVGSTSSTQPGGNSSGSFGGSMGSGNGGPGGSFSGKH